MKNDLESLRTEAMEKISVAKTVADLEMVHQEFFGRKSGKLNAILKQLKDLSDSDKKVYGKMSNDLKRELEEMINQQSTTIQKAQFSKLGGEFFDLTLPGARQCMGRMHPISRLIQDIEDVFTSMGFEVAEGPLVEDDYHNFTALNIPKDHPARDMQDTFWFADVPYLLRTHTSNCQIRHMENHEPPIRVICPGRVFRKDDADATHSPMFHQFEGIMVDEKTNVSHLKGVLTVAYRALVHPDIELRFRSGYFPFTEPSLEVDVTCFMCEGKGCSVCKKTGWIEMLGSGMVHPNVLRNVGIDPERYQGFAFGAGIERLLMIKYKITDIRLFYENDPRFLEQF